jgi:regulator of nucleoside diphosphate kinase
VHKHNLIISSADRDRLQNLLDSARLDRGVPLATVLALEGELARATIVNSADVPANVVAMNSTVWIRDLDSDEIENYTLVFPNEADVWENRISILAPIGTALLGYRLRDVIHWQVPAGTRRLEIIKVAQQEELAEAFA